MWSPKINHYISVNSAFDEPRSKTMSPLHVAARYGRYDEIKLLIQNGSLVNSIFHGTEMSKFTPLHLAIQGNHPNCVRHLLECGASLSPDIKDFCHPIHLAVYYNHVEVVEVLLGYGIDVNTRFNNSFFDEFEDQLDPNLWFNHNLPLLHYSILRKFHRMTNLILTFGADINLKTSLDKTALMQAVEVNDSHTVEYLVVTRKANVNDRDISGQPVLHFLMINAARNSMREVWNYKVRSEYFSYKSKDKILMILVDNGADVNARFPVNEQRSSVIHYMIKDGFSYGVRYLLYHSNFDFSEIDSKIINSLRDSVVRKIVANSYELRILFNQIKILKDLEEKAISLQMIGLPINENLIVKSLPFNWRLEQELILHISLCKNETGNQINYMKTTKIFDSNITIWHLLTCEMNELIKLVTKTIVKDFQVPENYHKSKMYYYCDILKNRLVYAKERIPLLEKSAEFVFNLFFKSNNLPYDCCEEIVEYLTNKDLKLFVDPAPLSYEK